MNARYVIDILLILFNCLNALINLIYFRILTLTLFLHLFNSSCQLFDIITKLRNILVNLFYVVSILRDFIILFLVHFHILSETTILESFDLRNIVNVFCNISKITLLVSFDLRNILTIF